MPDRLTGAIRIVICNEEPATRGRRDCLCDSLWQAAGDEVHIRLWSAVQNHQIPDRHVIAYDDVSL